MIICPISHNIMIVMYLELKVLLIKVGFVKRPGTGQLLGFALASGPGCSHPAGSASSAFPVYAFGLAGSSGQ